MNIVKILLVLGLGYVATTQKVEKTRNMLLVVTGLLAFCMFSVEGFTIAADQAMGNIFSDTITGGLTTAPGTRDVSTPVVVTSPTNRYTFSGDAAIDLNGTAPIPTTVTCKTGTAGDTAGTVGYKSGVTWSTTPPSGASIDDYLTCEAADDSANSDCPGYTSTNKPPFCECLKKTEGGHYHCNSGWTGDTGSVGKYIAKNAAGTGWEFKDDYTDEKVYKCDADMLSSISGGAVELFSGKCFVKKDETYTTQECLNLCDAPTPS
jgi:hypothetical protein